MLVSSFFFILSVVFHNPLHFLQVGFFFFLSFSFLFESSGWFFFFFCLSFLLIFSLSQYCMFRTKCIAVPKQEGNQEQLFHGTMDHFRSLDWAPGTFTW